MWANILLFHFCWIVTKIYLIGFPIFNSDVNKCDRFWFSCFSFHFVFYLAILAPSMCLYANSDLMLLKYCISNIFNGSYSIANLFRFIFGRLRKFQDSLRYIAEQLNVYLFKFRMYATNCLPIWISFLRFHFSLPTIYPMKISTQVKDKWQRLVLCMLSFFYSWIHMGTKFVEFFFIFLCESYFCCLLNICGWFLFAKTRSKQQQYVFQCYIKLCLRIKNFFVDINDKHIFLFYVFDVCMYTVYIVRIHLWRFLNGISEINIDLTSWWYIGSVDSSRVCIKLDDIHIHSSIRFNGKISSWHLYDMGTNFEIIRR